MEKISMKRNSILAGLLAAAAITISTPSFAHGYYYTDYYDQTMHPAVDCGVYVGLDVGYAVDQWNNLSGINDLYFTPSTVTIDTSQDKVGYRGFLGYMFNSVWALELGYAIFNNNSITVTDSVAQPAPPHVVFGRSVKTNVLDLLLRASIPLNNNFSVYTKAGLGYMSSLNVPDLTHPPSGPGPELRHQNRTHVNVAFGLGVLYRIAPHWAADLSWLHYSGNLNIGASFQPEIDYFSLGLAVIFPT